MALPPESTHELAPHRLVRLLDGGGPPNWREEELGQILTHQLDAPLLVDISVTGVQTLSPPARFVDLLTAADPNLILLRLTKDFAKAQLCHRDGAFPHPVAQVLYAATIAAALATHGCRISTLTESALSELLTWARRLNWLDPRLRAVLASGYDRLVG